MASLASLSSQLRQKDSEKTAILSAVKELKALQEHSVAGQLRFSVVSLSGNEMIGCSTNFILSPPEANLSMSQLKDLEIGSEVEMNLTTKNITIQILCVSSKTAVTCSASFDLKDAPDNNSMSTQLEAVSESGATFEMHVKVTYDTIDGLLESKQLELEEVESDIKSTAEKLRDASAKNSAPKARKEKASQPKKREQQPVDVSDFDGDDSEENGGFIQTISGGFFTGVGLMWQHKAVVAFGVVAYAIFAHGEALSV